MRITLIHNATGEEFNAYDDGDGIWLDDVESPGYLHTLKGWTVVR